MNTFAVQKNYNEYFKRKSKELNLLDSQLILENQNVILNIIKVFNDKLKAQSKMKIKTLKKMYNYQNTSRNIQKYRDKKIRLRYNYQRYDIHINLNNYMNLFYGIDNINYKYVFTNCGVSSLHATIEALNKKLYRVYSKGNIYVETERLITDYLNNHHNYKYKCLLLDTVSFKSLNNILENIEINKYDAFILDSTLYTKNEIQKIISQIIAKKKLLIVVRSHTKLDMLGCEWSNLGSICLISNDEKTLDDLYKEMRVILSFTGGFAYFNSIPQYWLNRKFKELSEARNAAIINNTEYIYRKLRMELKNIEIIKPDHNRFILIKPNRFIDYKRLEKDLHYYSEHSPLSGLINYADSFGLDSFGINGYYINMSSKTEVIRISPSDYPTEICDLIIDDFISWIKKYLNIKE